MGWPLLYGDLTIEQLKSDHYQSRTRNKLVAESFYLTKDIEKYGSGYIRVRREISSYPSMKFEYEESGNGYLVSLNYQIQKTSSTDISGGVSGGVNELLELIRSTPGRKSSDFRTALGQPQRTIERWLKHLKDTEKIEFRGAPKTGGYFVKIGNS